MRILIFVISLLCLVSCKQEKSQSNEDYIPSRRGVLGNMCICQQAIYCIPNYNVLCYKEKRTIRGIM